MKKYIVLLAIAFGVGSCAHSSVTPYQAATHHYRGCKNMR